MATIVLDPGHGGNTNIGGSDFNHASSPSGVLEKALTLDILKRVNWSLLHGSGKSYADQQGKQVTVVMTRTDDTNLSLDDRAATAAQNNADLYLSLHFNGWDGSVRGTEAYVDRKYMEPKRVNQAGRITAMEGPGLRSSGLRNINSDEDAAFASAIATATVHALKQFDQGAKLRTGSYTASRNGEAWSPPPGVKMLGLGTLRDAKLGTSNNACKACLLEMEFMDHPKVDAVLNGATASDARNAVAAALARTIVDFC